MVSLLAPAQAEDLTVQVESTTTFTATLLDQFGNPMAEQPTITWEATAGELDGLTGASTDWTAPMTPGTGSVSALTDGFSAMRSIIIIPAPEPGQRAIDGLIALYGFDEGGGSTIADQVPLGPNLDLVIPDLSKVTWQESGLEVDQSPFIGTAGDDMTAALQATDAFDSRGLDTPANNSQGGPARVVTLSNDSSNRNVTLGANAQKWQVRIRTASDTSNNGTSPSIESGNVITTDLTHVVFTRDADGNSVITTGVAVKEQGKTGNLEAWSNGYQFGIAGEANVTGTNRAWSGFTIWSPFMTGL